MPTEVTTGGGGGGLAYLLLAAVGAIAANGRSYFAIRGALLAAQRANAAIIVEIAKSEIRLPEGPFRVAGEYEVTLHLHTDIDTTLKVTVLAED